MAVDDGYVHPNVGMYEAQLIDDERIGPGMQMFQFLLMKRSADLWVGAHAYSALAALEHVGRFAIVA
jgi:hypothetical protein